jgi:hypothetical protein
MLYQLHTPEKPYTFEASNFSTACVVATLLGGGFYSLWQDGKQIMPVFMFGGVEQWYQRGFGSHFTRVAQDVSREEISAIYMTILADKPQELQRYLQELSMLRYSKVTLPDSCSRCHPQRKPTHYDSCKTPDGGDVVRLLDQRELPIQEILGEIGTNLWLVDLGEIPSYPITPGKEGCWEEIAISVA